MKKICICILLPLFFLNGTLWELFKLPVLYAHFMEHRRLDNSIDMIDFLSMHYIGDDMNEHDQDRDMQLPFKKLNDSTSFELVVIPLSGTTFELGQKFVSEQKLFPVSRDGHFSNPTSGTLFRPPIA